MYREGVLIPTGIVVLQRGSNTIVYVHADTNTSTSHGWLLRYYPSPTEANFVCLNWCRDYTD